MSWGPSLQKGNRKRPEKLILILVVHVSLSRGILMHDLTAHKIKKKRLSLMIMCIGQIITLLFPHTCINSSNPGTV